MDSEVRLSDSNEFDRHAREHGEWFYDNGWSHKGESFDSYRRDERVESGRVVEFLLLLRDRRAANHSVLLHSIHGALIEIWEGAINTTADFERMNAIADETAERMRQDQAAARNRTSTVAPPSRDDVLRQMEGAPLEPGDPRKTRQPCPELVAMGPAALPGLIAALDGPYELAAGVRRTLVVMGAPALEALTAALPTASVERAGHIAQAMRLVAAQLRPGTPALSGAARALVALLRSKDPEPGKRWVMRRNPHEAARVEAVWALGLLRDPMAVDALIEALADRNTVCVGAARALGRIGHAAAVRPLVGVLQAASRFWVPRGAAAVALGDLGPRAAEALPALREALDYTSVPGDETWDARAREAVVDAIRRIEEPGTPSRLVGPRYEMW